VAGEDSGLASGLLNTSYQVGSSLGLALLAALAASEAEGPAALTEGFRRAFVAGGLIAAAGSAAAVAILVRRATSTSMAREGT
jgi:hypothetical protein